MMPGALSTANPKQRFVGWGGRLGEVGLGTAIIAVVVMMVVPLTPWLVDLLIGLNLSFSVLVLSLSLFIARPLAFTAFPTLLLVATLYRLALNVSTTRLILLQADAGRIVSGFGGYVVGSDIIIGTVIYGILALVLFLVITKGAERVAEVSARFSLDALPGQQLGIDADLRAGGISTVEAGRKRDALDRKSRYYGALDGAMKFVRGDAIASLVITGVNIVGGLSVGMIRHGMSASQAIDTYGRLTIGDGLVTLIPALFVSTAAGFLVTRIAGGDEAGDRLGAEVGKQIFSEPSALGAATVLLLGLALIPGLPAWPFIVLAVPLGTAAAWRFSGARRDRLRRIAPDDLIDDWPVADDLAVLTVGRHVYDALDRELGGAAEWRGFSGALARRVAVDLGIRIARVPVVRTDDASPDEMSLQIRGMTCRRQRLEEAEQTPGRVKALADRWLKAFADRLIGMDEAAALIDRITRERPVLVRETIPQKLDLPLAAALLKALVADGISLTHFGEILESLARGPKTDDVAALVERARTGMRSVISHRLLGNDASLSVWLLAPETESVLLSSLVKGEGGTRLVLADEDGGRLVRAVDQATRAHEKKVLVVSAPLRRPLQTRLASPLPEVTVLKSSELEPDIPIDVVDRIEL